jgi:hypothetical protein
MNRYSEDHQMSTIQFQNFLAFRKLLAQLRAYGLNPYDWKIERTWNDAKEIDQLHFNLRHKADQEFRLSARSIRSSQGRLKLKSLALVSL